MTVIIANRARWHHPLRIALNHIKKWLAFVGLIVIVAGAACLIGQHR